MLDRPPNPEKIARLARQAAALRANLAKRKAQAQERANARRPAAPQSGHPKLGPTDISRMEAPLLVYRAFGAH